MSKFESSSIDLKAHVIDDLEYWIEGLYVKSDSHKRKNLVNLLKSIEQYSIISRYDFNKYTKHLLYSYNYFIKLNDLGDYQYLLWIGFILLKSQPKSSFIYSYIHFLLQCIVSNLPFDSNSIDLHGKLLLCFPILTDLKCPKKLSHLALNIFNLINISPPYIKSTEIMKTIYAAFKDTSIYRDISTMMSNYDISDHLSFDIDMDRQMNFIQFLISIQHLFEYDSSIEFIGQYIDKNLIFDYTWKSFYSLISPFPENPQTFYILLIYQLLNIILNYTYLLNDLDPNFQAIKNPQILIKLYFDMEKLYILNDHDTYYDCILLIFSIICNCLKYSNEYTKKISELTIIRDNDDVCFEYNQNGSGNFLVTYLIEKYISPATISKINLVGNKLDTSSVLPDKLILTSYVLIMLSFTIEFSHFQQYNILSKIPTDFPILFILNLFVIILRQAKILNEQIKIGVEKSISIWTKYKPSSQ